MEKSVYVADMPEVHQDEVHTHVQRALQSLLLEDKQGAAGYLRRALTCLNNDVGGKVCRPNSLRSNIWKADWS